MTEEPNSEQSDDLELDVERAEQVAGGRSDGGGATVGRKAGADPMEYPSLPPPPTKK